VLWTDDVDGSMAKPVASSAQLLSPTHDFLEAQLRAAWIADPEGNRIQLVQRGS